MATIRKRGKSYQIRVSTGYDVTGKQLEKSMTWTPSPNMTEKQIEKELNRQAVLFEEKCLTGQFLDGNITFAEFADRWFRDYAEKQLKKKTVKGYKDLYPRINTAIGHIRLCRLQPHHLLEFYNNLAEKGIRLDTKYKACNNFKDIVTALGYTQNTLSEAANVGITTLRACYNDGTVSKQTADKITAAIGKKNLFEPVNKNASLSEGTIVKYHRLISTILTTAVQWQVIPSNPCQRVKPPRAEYKEAPVLDDVQTLDLIKHLENEPIKIKAAVMLMLYTGFRRGELCGLDWSDIDLKNGIVHVKKTIQYIPEIGIYEDTPKSKRSNRVIQIPSDMVELLEQYQTEQLKQQLLLGDLWQNSSKVFTSDIGGILRPDTLSSWIKNFIKRHDLPEYTHTHTLRHTSATLLIANGVDVATVSNRLGHANKSTTLNIYTHAIKSADEKAAEKLQDIFTSTAAI